MNRLITMKRGRQTTMPHVPGHHPRGFQPVTWKSKTTTAPTMQLTIAPLAVALFQKKAPNIVGTTIKRPAAAAEERGAIMKASPVWPAAHQAKTKAMIAIIGITHLPTLSSPASESLGLIRPLWMSRAHIEERVSRIESIVVIAAAVIPIITIMAKATGIIGKESRVGVARSAFSNPGTSNLALNPHNTDIRVYINPKMKKPPTICFIAVTDFGMKSL